MVEPGVRINRSGEEELCDPFDVSGIRDFRIRLLCVAKPQANEKLLAAIGGVLVESGWTYGAPRIAAQLCKSGVEVSVNRVARLMQKARLSACVARIFVCTTRCSGRAHGIVDRVNREFNVSEPDQLWVADATYLHTLDGVLYLAVVQDACSRRILGWSMKTCQDVGLMSEALQMALRGRSCEGVIHHSEQGLPTICQQLLRGYNPAIKFQLNAMRRIHVLGNLDQKSVGL